MYKVNLYKGQLVLKEDELQRQCVEWFYMQYGNWQENVSAPMLFHNANENPKTKTKISGILYNKKMKDLGRITGMPDLILYNNKTGKCIFIEMKAIDGKLSNNQENILRYLNAYNKVGYVCKTLKEFQDVVNNFLNNDN